MALIKHAIEKSITKQLINSSTISTHSLCFCLRRLLLVSTQFWGEICQSLCWCLLRPALAFRCPRGTDFFQVHNLACQMSLLFHEDLWFMLNLAFFFFSVCQDQWFNFVFGKPAGFSVGQSKSLCTDCQIETRDVHGLVGKVATPCDHLWLASSNSVIHQKSITLLCCFLPLLSLR